MAASKAVVFDKDLAGGKDDRFVKVLTAKADAVEYGEAKKLRLMYLLPKLGADLTGGFASGLTPKVHAKLALGEGEVMTELVAVSDCKTWLGFVMAVLSGNTVYYKGYYGDKGDLKVGGYKDLADFVKGKVTGGAKAGLVKLMPSHVLAHMLMA
ncbi:hypothetical protein MACK_002567 [Theileria orientalis]|uniref:Uncharacterized protein n=1 Tax=Theileria orientalis TaxID=68886 RepID=A0A976QTR4_THEOR|nr:hypothetical protein MACK_002567 [Theileria orientalis]